MHSPSAVRYPLARLSRAGWVLVGGWLLGAGLCAWWALGPGVGAWLQVSAAACVLASGGVALGQWRALPQGALRWDGGQWCCERGGGELPVAVDLRADFGSAMVLRLDGWPGRAPWCCVERRQAPALWLDLRRAVHAARQLPLSATAEARP